VKCQRVVAHRKKIAHGTLFALISSFLHRHPLCHHDSTSNTIVIFPSFPYSHTLYYHFYYFIHNSRTGNKSPKKCHCGRWLLRHGPLAAARQVLQHGGHVLFSQSFYYQIRTSPRPIGVSGTNVYCRHFDITDESQVQAFSPNVRAATLGRIGHYRCRSGSPRTGCDTRNQPSPDFCWIVNYGVRIIVPNIGVHTCATTARWLCVRVF
jgi:hypothetical protein